MLIYSNFIGVAPWGTLIVHFCRFCFQFSLSLNLKRTVSRKKEHLVIGMRCLVFLCRIHLWTNLSFAWNNSAGFYLPYFPQSKTVSRRAKWIYNVLPNHFYPRLSITFLYLPLIVAGLPIPLHFMLLVVAYNFHFYLFYLNT